MEKRQAKKRTKGIPVTNQDTGRTVYVLPETLQKDPDKFQKVPPDESGDPRWRGKPKPPARPRRPEKPEVPRDPPPAPIHPETPQKRIKLTKPVVEVPDVQEMKVPEPSPPRRWKRLKKYNPMVANSATVLRRFLALLDDA